MSVFLPIFMKYIWKNQTAYSIITIIPKKYCKNRLTTISDCTSVSTYLLRIFLEILYSITNNT